MTVNTSTHASWAADEIAALQTDHAVDEELAAMREKLSTKTSG